MNNSKSLQIAKTFEADKLISSGHFELFITAEKMVRPIVIFISCQIEKQILEIDLIISSGDNNRIFKIQNKIIDIFKLTQVFAKFLKSFIDIYAMN